MEAGEAAVIDQRVRETMAAVLGLAPGAIDADTSVETVGAWDSIQHINLIMALQEAFGVLFEPSEITAMLSYPAVVRTLEGKL